jgi:hypothetical protein
LRREAGEEVMLFGDWSWLRRHGVMPYPGGRDDQSPLFIDAAEVIEDELARIEQRRGHDGKRK